MHAVAHAAGSAPPPVSRVVGSWMDYNAYERVWQKVRRENYEDKSFSRGEYTRMLAGQQET
eukprot:1603522-Lingulodinium_polyedra.AAC.1